jgi:ribosomal protein S18 acetylase RimI-like enzyme
MITTSNQISPAQLLDLERLAALCKKADGSIPNLYTHILTQARAFPASIFYYQENQLLGFLSAYFFYDDAVEISLMVHPLARKKGISRELMREILPLIQFQNYHRLIFSSPAHKNHQWLRSQGYTYLHSEYYMEREELNPILQYNQSLSFRTAAIADIPALCGLDEACFAKKQGDLISRFQQLLDSREYQIFLAFQNNQLIGKAHLRWQKQGATLSDIAISPSKQGKGFGSSLIAHCINLALSEGKPLINLDVETHNQRALNLYIRLGFVIQNACDYWSISVDNILSKQITNTQ